MITQKAVLDMMESYQDTPEAAEAAYLAAEGLGPDQINANLQPRYGSSQGYAQFKEDLLEVSEYDGVYTDTGGYGADIGLRTEEDDDRLDQITAQDIDIALDQVIKDAFIAKNTESLKDEIYDNLTTLTEQGKIIAVIARKGHDMGLWDDDPEDETIWTTFSLLTDETPPDRRKEDLKDELLRTGVLYDTDGSILLTPVFANLEDPYKHLPQIQLQQPSSE